MIESNSKVHNTYLHLLNKIGNEHNVKVRFVNVIYTGFTQYANELIKSDLPIKMKRHLLELLYSEHFNKIKHSDILFKEEQSFLFNILKAQYRNNKNLLHKRN